MMWWFGSAIAKQVELRIGNVYCIHYLPVPLLCKLSLIVSMI